ncbi:MAG TPA: RNA-binding protein [Chitinophagaceae bacterium]|jgi:RNA recognition motif-containing protein|nr:RNA-binding protein [Chitinophagaceae bacterium]
MNIYVANIGFNTSADQLRRLFAEFGRVITSGIFTDRQTGNSRGFGYVMMECETEATIALDKLNGTDINGRIISVVPPRKKTIPENRY